MAHRGGAALGPENTLPAFAAAVAGGADVLEMDIRITADGVPVVIHDPLVDRTTDGRGPVRGLPLSRLRALDAGYSWTPDGGRTFPFRGRGTFVPTLEEVFAAFPGHRMNIDIKENDPDLVRAFCRLIRKHGRKQTVTAASFDGEALRRFRRECPGVATAATRTEVVLFSLLGDVFGTPPFQALQVPEKTRGIRVLTPAFLSSARRLGIPVHVWTVNDPGEMARLLRLGVDGIFTDNPPLLRRVLDGLRAL